MNSLSFSVFTRTSTDESNSNYLINIRKSKVNYCLRMSHTCRATHTVCTMFTNIEYTTCELSFQTFFVQYIKVLDHLKL